MKRIILSAAVLLLSATMFGQKKANDIAKFEKEAIDQGVLKQNNPEEVKFVVTNISNAPLIIEQASPTCGCTIGDYTKTPIAPGAKGFVSAKFNAANVGHFEKHLTVKFAGADDIKSITISGEVKSVEEYDKWKTGAAPVAATVVAAKSPVVSTPMVKPVATKVTTTSTTKNVAKSTASASGAKKHYTHHRRHHHHYHKTTTVVSHKTATTTVPVKK